MKLVNVVVDKPINPNFSESVINSRTDIKQPQPTETTFQRQEPVLTLTTVNLVQQKEVNNLVFVEGVVTLRSNNKSTEVFGKPTDLSENNYITDHTGNVSLTVWEEWISFFKDNADQNVKHFKPFNLIVKYYVSKGIHVSTCRETFADRSTPTKEIQVEVPMELTEEEANRYTRICISWKVPVQLHV